MNRQDGGSRRTTVADLATLVVALSAVTMVGMTAWSQFRGPPDQISLEDREIANWTEVAEAGHRRGPDDAPITIVVFSDYECPFCRTLAGPLQAITEAYPLEVAVVHRHFPLESHPNAYQAARFAECGAEQDRGHEVHRLLFQAVSLTGLEAGMVATMAQVPDTTRFLDCARRTEPVAAIEEDLRVAKNLGINSVPTIIFDGTWLGVPPDSARLFSLVEEGLLER